MKKNLSSIKRAYLAGFLDGDGSIYVRAKLNSDYRYGFQVAPAIILFQSAKDRSKFEEVCSLINLGYIRTRNDGILEYTINKIDNIIEFLKLVEPFVILKRKQVVLMKQIIEQKKKVKQQKDFEALLKLIDSFRELNYSKRRKIRTLTL
ncbi:MAG: LAGLIDADG family homing endonuclease [Candidatus Yanofskybacteria bacterium]|nr:LAGLIDADG family homing endonuclease [Candidatus Yanofskybacteria bacterium]